MKEDINSTTNPNQNTTDLLSFTYNGVSVNENSFIIREQYGDINITLLNYNGYDFFLKLDYNLNVGSYNFNTSNYYGRIDANIYTSTASFYNGESGNLTITNHNTSNRFIKGTFSFIATDDNRNNPQTVTNGSFQSNY